MKKVANNLNTETAGYDSDGNINNDPVNQIDPTGEIANVLLGGLEGGIINFLMPAETAWLHL